MVEPRPDPYLVTLLRHGESVGNAQARWQGQSEFPLNEQGRAQAQALAGRWKAEAARFDLIITSPLSRARETAAILSEALNVPVEDNPLWMERNVDRFSGLTPSEVNEALPPSEFKNPYGTVGGDGEGDWELFLRGGRALLDLIRRPVGRYLVVSHGGLLNQVMQAVVGIVPQIHDSGPRFRFGNTGFARLLYYPHQHRWTIDTLNDLAHWKNEQRSLEI